jgi:hypothetical protein
MRQDAFLKLVEKAAENSTITQEEADQIVARWKQRPEAVDHLMPRALCPPRILRKHTREEAQSLP